jgi:hypothetical protein
MGKEVKGGETHAQSSLLNVVARQEKGAELLHLLLETSYTLRLLIGLKKRGVRSAG